MSSAQATMQDPQADELNTITQRVEDFTDYGPFWKELTQGNGKYLIPRVYKIRDEEQKIKKEIERLFQIDGVADEQKDRLLDRLDRNGQALVRATKYHCQSQAKVALSNLFEGIENNVAPHYFENAVENACEYYEGLAKAILKYVECGELEAKDLFGRKGMTPEQKAEVEKLVEQVEKNLPEYLAGLVNDAKAQAIEKRCERSLMILDSQFDRQINYLTRSYQAAAVLPTDKQPKGVLDQSTIEELKRMHTRLQEIQNTAKQGHHNDNI